MESQTVLQNIIIVVVVLIKQHFYVLFMICTQL